ncbi:hypothetical protein Gasu2_26940 [Galdieria sulphuraria]|uniref:Uncharacterized protein n=1 Tax=Galdieria sulphuraria TaxID=130081 RepID=M2X1I4_GALSU|nr:uncharacterized protein Gasu_23750 [Galdieria sulphuraria]EME30220.1 hypothetical protein Gasu_23750 [Galdieria sulphuraria]GJD08388.1 hypothetical protein Gasu2_26940 [Galdieria sulphuraria]|eukprot:XP_005706740.1 hypothetical protein Gasu_23750 [Galdieria sulphuraria]
MWICFSPGCASRAVRDTLCFWPLRYSWRSLAVTPARLFYTNPLETRRCLLRHIQFLRFNTNNGLGRAFCMSQENQLEKSWWHFLQTLQQREKSKSQVCDIDGVSLRKHAHDVLASSGSLALSVEVEKKRQELNQLLQEHQDNILDENLCRQLEVLGNAILYHLESGKTTLPVSRTKGTAIGCVVSNSQDKFIGKQPNVLWRSIDKSILRSHPLYRPLPPPYLIKVASCHDFRMLRQDSEEWKIARSFSQVSASTLWKILGFGERRAATFLGLPNSMKGHHHAIHAWKSLLNPSFEEVYDSVSKIRLKWGHSHEANCLLAFLEYMHSFQDIRMQEVGLFVLEKGQVLPQWNIFYEELPTISASPDALFRVRKTNGVWSVWQLCEAKCRCPFVPRIVASSLHSSLETSSPEKGPLFRNKDILNYANWSFLNFRPLEKLSPIYFAQMQLQMLCANIEEQGYLISYSVTKGSNIFQVTRSNEWLGACLSFVREFYNRYGRKESSAYPPDDFFWDVPGYQDFLQLTKDLTSQCTVWKHISYEDFNSYIKF